MNIDKLILLAKLVNSLSEQDIRKIFSDVNFGNLKLESLNEFRSWINVRLAKVRINKTVSPMSIRRAKDRYERLEKELLNNDISFISFLSPRFPETIKKLDNYPVILFLKGEKHLLEARNRSLLIGTRNPSLDGVKWANLLANRLISDDKVIVSGLAKGVDTIVHNACVTRNHPTIAVLPCGILNIYPKENTSLADSILKAGGLLISAYLPKEVVTKNKFVERDFIQAALSDECLVVETTETGGTMYAAKATREIFNNPLYAVDPDLIKGDASGNKLLIEKYGAKKLIC